jgi:hypothetical protein
MKTNTIQLIATSVVVGSLALFATSKMIANFNLLAAAVGYAAVVIMGAVAYIDYRRNHRNYATR